MLTKKNSISNLFSAIHIVLKGNIKKVLLALIASFLSFSAISQTNFQTDIAGFNSDIEQFYKVISFGEKIDFGNIENTATFTVTNSKENIIVNLRGTQINNYIFEKPGIYEIRFFENKIHKAEECQHAMFSEKMSVKVNSVKITFDFSKIKFSEKIQTGRNYDNLIITVPVVINTKEKNSPKYDAPNMTIAGVGSELIAIPIDSEIIAKNGIQLLKYQLSGMVTKETYLMFRFWDLNDEAQTYNLLEKIN